jgi:hypothetical protein
VSSREIDHQRGQQGRGWLTVERTVTVLAGLGGLATAVIAALLIFWPGLRPDPPPPRLGAQISKVTVAQDVTLAAFHRQIGLSDQTEIIARRLAPALGRTRVGYPPPENGAAHEGPHTLARTLLTARGTVIMPGCAPMATSSEPSWWWRYSTPPGGAFPSVAPRWWRRSPTTTSWWRPTAFCGARFARS